MTLNSVMSILFKFMLFFVFFILFLQVLTFFLFKKPGKNISGLKVNLYGLLMEIDNFTILALSVSLIRYVFIIWTIFDSSSIGFVHVFMLIIFSILFGLFSKNIKNLLFESISSIAIYYALISSRLLTNYLVDIRFVWYVFLGDIMLKIFIILYTTFFLLRNINSSVVKTKYIRRERIDEDNS
ncbi:MAG: hypothetical protein IKH54_04250 [Bacilli bacterium]|nr:hypothetical protein [Bacilli bacterium]